MHQCSPYPTRNEFGIVAYANVETRTLPQFADLPQSPALSRIGNPRIGWEECPRKGTENL
jgi:hypothetical protein